MKGNVKTGLACVLGAAAIYLLMDLPVQLTGFLQFGPAVGVKNCLPPILGLLLGPLGAVGCAAGSAAGALLLGTPPGTALYECLCCLIIATGTWLLWHAGSTTHRVHFKRAINFAKYAGILLALSGACGALSFLLVPGGLLAGTVAGYTSMGLLVGIPMLTLFNSAMCFDSLLPPGAAVKNDVEGEITSDPFTLGAINEAIDELAMDKGIGMKRVMEVQNCIEELSIRILRVQPEARIAVKLNEDDAISVALRFAGSRYNPLHMGRDEDELDVMSLKLIKHRALRAAYSYADGENRIRIVI